jgi:hypothetical protein
VEQEVNLILTKDWHRVSIRFGDKRRFKKIYQDLIAYESDKGYSYGGPNLLKFEDPADATYFSLKYT